MGTDIHVQIEVKRHGRWEWPFTNLPSYVRRDNLLGSIVPDDRCYDFFAMLADVRNGRGFAGCVTGEGFEPISQPKGLPDDLSSELHAAAQLDYLLGEHSFSWLTHGELVAYGKKHFRHDSPTFTTIHGWVTAGQYLRWKADGKPAAWSGGVSGMSVRNVSNEYMEEVFMANPDLVPVAWAQKPYGQDGPPELQHLYTRVSWKTTYMDAIGWERARLFMYGLSDFLVYADEEDCAMETRAIAEGRGDAVAGPCTALAVTSAATAVSGVPGRARSVEDVRIVFGFDS